VRIRNTHRRQVGQSVESLGACLDSLSSAKDQLWPHELWPRMTFNQPLGVGARGGHGPIRYFVEEYEPGKRVVFRFTDPKGFLGTHSFQVNRAKNGAEIVHLIAMEVSGSALLSWPLIIRPLHDALLEDSLDKVGAHLAGEEWVQRDWPISVKFLRRILARRGRKSS
jgi:hypothetical protein